MIKKQENPPNRFESRVMEFDDGENPPVRLEIFEDQTRNILSENKSPDLMFRWSLNPYRGCSHACIYCYARPTHEYLGFGAGTDFETRLVVKKRAPELLRATFQKKNWRGERIVFSGDTDCYQPVEAHFQLTRKCLEACVEFSNPVSIITKSSLILRDFELLKELNRKTDLDVTVSIPFRDDKMARVIEPQAASVEKRFETVQKLAEAGIDMGVNIAPVIPGLNDSDIPKLLERAKKCGARRAAIVLLRLPWSVKDVFVSRIRKHYPGMAEKILKRIQEVRGGKLTDPRFGNRFHGKGDYWDNIEKLFDLYCRRLGLNKREMKFTQPKIRKPVSAPEMLKKNFQKDLPLDFQKRVA